jgi:hypothetical protein
VKRGVPFFCTQQVLEISWAELTEPLEANRRGEGGAVLSVQHLIDAHARYIAMLQERTMLTSSAAKVQELLRGLLGEVFAFTNQVQPLPSM